MLLAKGYPDIGWNPIEGERYLSFLRFAVFVNGRSSGVFHSSSCALGSAGTVVTPAHFTHQDEAADENEIAQHPSVNKL